MIRPSKQFGRDEMGGHVNGLGLKSISILAVLCVAAAAAGPVAAAPTTAPVPTTAPAPPKGARIVKEGWFAPRPAVERPKLPEKIKRAFVIPIQGPITPTLAKVIKKKVIRCKGGGAEIVIFDLDTPGGRTDAMDDIVRVILNDLKNVYTVAYVNPEAISAGAIISLACDEIVMAPTGKVGDSMPVMFGPQGYLPIPEKERGKLESYMRSQVRVLAKRNGHNVVVCEAMVTITDVIWLIRHRTTRELRLVDAGEHRGRVANTPPTTQPVRVGAPPAQAEWEYVRTVDGPNELITATADEAVELGLVEHILEDMDALCGHFNIVAKPKRLEDSWSESLVDFLTSPMVMYVLFFIGILAVYTELHTPGLGVAGAIAVACFVILFGSQYMIGLAQWWEIALFGVGLVLIAVEVFITPGFGVMGISGILCCVVSMLAMLVANPPGEMPLPKTDLDWSLFSNGVLALSLAFICSLIAAAFLSRYLPKVPVARRLILAPAEAAIDAPVSDSSPMMHVQVGDAGVVEAPCRPVGKVRFGDELLDATSEGESIEAGVNVRIIRRDGNRLIIERA